MKAKYLICCLSMAFALVACGDDSSSGPDQVQSGETTVSSSYWADRVAEQKN